MKSAYELAMERLKQSTPARTLTPAQKKALAEIDSVYQAKIAQLELRTQDALAEAKAMGDGEKVELIRGRFRQEKAELEGEREVKKEGIRKK